MTTAASFPSLQAPLAEDSMEMSSPAQQLYDDDDIEIDFDEHIGGVELTDDERMVDDTEQPRPGTATDDMMEDDAPTPDAQAPEQEMQDDFDAVAYEQADPDDELIDYDEDEYQDMGESTEQNAFEPSAPEITLEDREPTDPGLDPVDEEIIRESEVPVQVPEVVVAEESVAEAAPAVTETAAAENSVAEAVPAVTGTAAAETTIVPPTEEISANGNDGGIEQQAVAAEQHAESDIVPVNEDQQHESNGPATPQELEPFPELPEDSPELKEAAPIAPFPAPLDTNLEVGDGAPGTPTDTGLHPMVIQYGDWEWPLFKSRRQPDGLLKDDNLASVALADLLNNCRSRLAMKAGEDISEDQEFVLRFDSTGLTIVENSPSAFSTSLDEILEVFKQLYVNDGAQSVPPFRLYLSLQPKPSSYLVMLKQAAAGGQGISSFVDVPAEEVSAHFEEYYQDGDEDPTLLGDASGVDYDHQAHEEGQDVTAEPELNQADYHEYETSYENTEGGQEAQEGCEQYEQYDDTEDANYEDYGDGDETNAHTAHVEHPHDAEPSEETAGSPHEHAKDQPTVSDREAEQDAAQLAPTAVEETISQDGENGEEEQGEQSNVESVASSTTLRADQANDAVGEYQGEDLIDWNDPTLTSNLSEDGTDEIEDEFSTFITEPDQESTQPQAAAGNDAYKASGDRDADVGDSTIISDERDLEDGSHQEQATEVLQISAETDSVTHDGDEANGSLGHAETLPSEIVGPDASQSLPLEDVGLNAEQTDNQQQETQVAQHGESKPLVTETNAEGATRNDEDYIDFGDEDGIDFDDDTYEQHEARKASEANSPVSPSPSGKRPLDETEGIDFAEQPELKKVKSS